METTQNTPKLDANWNGQVWTYDFNGEEWYAASAIRVLLRDIYGIDAYDADDMMADARIAYIG